MFPEKKRFFQRTSVRILIGFLVLILAIVVYFAVVAIDRPPEINDLTSLSKERISMGNNSYSFGNNWIRKNDTGLWEAYLEGEPFERGVAFGQLTKELLYYQETAFFEQIRELVPSDNYLKLLKYFIAFFNRNLDKNIPVEYKEEIYGTSFACSPEYDFIGSGYQRQLNYHAAHDIGHALQGLNLVACTSFSVWDGKSTDSSLLIGRNFDFYMGEKFAENKIVCFVNPSQGFKFMMITWADLIGVVSGMNEKGLTVTLNASRSSVPTQSATPVTILAREILQYASTIQEALAIAEKRKLFVSESLMIGSAIDHQTAIIEKSPEKTALLTPASNKIICSNHFQSTAFAKDEANIENINGSDSYKRYLRVEELISQQNKMGVKDVASVLRNQHVLGDSDAGMGNQLAINQLIAHHSVIFEPENLMVWVSTGPWQLGKFIAYDLHKVFGLKLQDISGAQMIYETGNTIDADTFLYSESYSLFREYQLMTRELRKFTSDKTPLPRRFVEDYFKTNPRYFQLYVNLGDYYHETGNYKLAYDMYSKALHKILPGTDERKKITERQEKSQKKISNGTSRN